MQKRILKLLKYTAFGIATVPLSIITHELGHFLAYFFFGAANIQLHSVSVSADKEALNNFQIAVVAITGPVITYFTIGIAAFLTGKTYRPFWVMLALAAPLGRIVNFIYIGFRLAGYNPNPNFDEFNFSKNLSIEPLLLSIVTCLLILATLIYFLKKTWRANGFIEVVSVIFGLAVGVAVWFSVGGLILP